MSGPRTPARRRLAPLPVLLPALLAALLAAVAGCGVEPGKMVDDGPAPVISMRSTVATVYLLHHGKLVPKNVIVASASVEDTMRALFEAGERFQEGVTTGLTGLRLEQASVSRYGQERGVRNDPENPLGLRLHVIVAGSGEMSQTAKAQITCTAMLRQEIWAVKLTEMTPDGPVAEGEHNCREFWRLADRSVQLPP